jgi:hypothetical protein
MTPWRCPHGLTSMQTCDACGRHVTAVRILYGALYVDGSGKMPTPRLDGAAHPPREHWQCQAGSAPTSSSISRDRVECSHRWLANEEGDVERKD